MTEPDVDSGRVPPHDVVAEVCVLGSMILDAGRIGVVGEIVQQGDFFRPAHQVIFGALSELAEQGRAVDLVMLRDELIRRGQLDRIGGVEYLTAIVEGVPTAENAEYYATIVRRHAAKRELAVLAAEINNAAFQADSEPGNLIERAQARLYEIEQKVGGRPDEMKLGEAVRGAMEDAEAAAEKPDLVGLKTGFGDLDKFTGGFVPGELVLLGGRTAAGKTTWSHNVAGHVAAQGAGVLIVSGEMPARQVGKRFLQAEAEVWGSKIRRGAMGADDWAAANEAETAMRGWPVYVVGHALTIPQVAIRGRQLSGRWRQPLALIVLDYIQIMQPHEGKTIREQIMAISRGAKQLAMDLHCVVLGISQFSRAAFAAGAGRKADRPPSIHELKESGTLEQDADIVLLLHKPEPQPAHARTDRSLELWLRVGKGRETGETPWPDRDKPDNGGIRLRWWPGLTLMGEWEAPLDERAAS